MIKLQCWLAQGRESTSYHLAAFSSVFSLHGSLYEVLRCVMNLSLGAICHVLNVVFWMEKWICITILKSLDTKFLTMDIDCRHMDRL